MQTPHVYVVREIEHQYAVYPLDSELMRFYPWLLRLSLVAQRLIT